MSAVKSGIAPNIPTAVRTTATTRALNITWGTPAGFSDSDIDDYLVTIRGGDHVITRSVEGTNLTLQGLIPNTTYAVSVRARNSAGISGTVSVSDTTEALAPSVKSLLTASTGNTYKTTWKAAATHSGKIAKYLLVVKQGTKTITKHAYKASAKSASFTLAKKGKYTVALTVYTTAGKHITKSKTIVRH